MTNDVTAARATGARDERCAIPANAAKVLETTRRAWSEATAHAPAEARGRAPRATQPRKRVVARRSRWPSLVAALHYWSPKPL
ncbi:hypothetical protein CR51_34335 [Caballeronia megalochromosomata]|nr:hypothetical protein CR51_34335 [Caballeronia megalochromosomata]